MECSVVVEVDKVENLREAYPNYFLDMSLFHSNLRRVIDGIPLRHSFTQDDPADRPKAAVQSIKTGDFSWLRNWKKK